MAEGGRHLGPDRGNRADEMDYPDMDWLEEPARNPRRQSAAWPGEQTTAQRPAQKPAQRPAQRPAQQPVRRTRRTEEIQWQQEQPPRGRQNTAPQRPQSQQRPAQRPQQRPAQRRVQTREQWHSDDDGRRYVEVAPDDYRPKRRGGHNLPIILLVVVLLGGVLFAGFKLGSALLNYHRDRTAYNNLANEALSDLAEPSATRSPEEPADPNEGQQQPPSEVPFAVNWDYLRSVNSDVIGWLYCADTPINYPVVQTVDNDYYLHRDFTTRQPNFAGTLFADPLSSLGVTHSNIIIYGHNMKDGSMFATAEDYVNQDFYNQHPVMYFLTPDQDYRIDLIAGRIVESSLDNYVNFFTDDASYAGYLNDITSHSFFATSAVVSTSYQLISMSTCDYSGSYNDPRFLLQGLLVPIT